MCASGQLGHGIPLPAFEAGIARSPDVIGADMGSTDIGPYYLGAGKPDGDRLTARRDLRLVLLAGRRLSVPVIIGSAGSAGGREHLNYTLDLVSEIAAAEGLSFRLAVIEASAEKSWVLSKLSEGKIEPCGPVPELTAKTIDDATHIVGQMGVEPFIAALDMGADLIIAGRACDAAIFAALPMARGFDPGLAMHMGKIIECSSLCADPGGRDAIMGTIRSDHFLVESMNPIRHCTPQSVAAHALYEQPNPFEVVEPGGRLDMTNSRYEAVSEHVTKVTGSRWVQADRYTVKLEGAVRVGHRYISMGAMRCPIAVGQVREIADSVRALVPALLPAEVQAKPYALQFRLYGVDGAMGNKEVREQSDGHEVLVVTDVVADSPETAKSICSVARYNLLHYFYPGIRATGGNLAVPFVPSDIYVGEAYEFAVYHLVTVDDPLEMFPIRLCDLNAGVMSDARV